MNELFQRNITELTNSLCDRRDLYSLHFFTSSILSINGLTDGWQACLDGFKDMRALCRDKLTEEEREKVLELINVLDKMLGESSRSQKQTKKLDLALLDKLEENIRNAFS